MHGFGIIIYPSGMKEYGQMKNETFVPRITLDKNDEI